MFVARIKEGANDHYWNICIKNGKSKSKVMRFTAAPDPSEYWLELLNEEMLATAIQYHENTHIWSFHTPRRERTLKKGVIKVNGKISPVVRDIARYMKLNWSKSEKVELELRHVDLAITEQATRRRHIKEASYQIVFKFLSQLNGWKHVTTMPETANTVQLPEVNGKLCYLRSLIWIPR